MRESRENPADEVKNEISQVTEAIFDIIAKDKKKKHIAEDVSDAAVHEHRSDQREISGNVSTGHSGRLYGLTGNRLDHETAGDRPIIASNDSLGNCRKLIGELLVAAEALEEHKYQHVNRDEHIVNDRRGGAASVIVAYWKKHRRACSIFYGRTTAATSILYLRNHENTRTEDDNNTKADCSCD